MPTSLFSTSKELGSPPSNAKKNALSILSGALWLMIGFWISREFWRLYDPTASPTLFLLLGGVASFASFAFVWVEAKGQPAYEKHGKLAFGCAVLVAPLLVNTLLPAWAALVLVVFKHQSLYYSSPWWSVGVPWLVQRVASNILLVVFPIESADILHAPQKEAREEKNAV